MSLSTMVRPNTIRITAFRVAALVILGLLIMTLVRLETYSASHMKSSHHVATLGIPQGRDESDDSLELDTAMKSTEVKLPLDDVIYLKPTEKRFTMEEFVSIQCPSDGDFSTKAWENLDCRKRLPSVLGIGFQRCGTTALNLFLSTHPAIKHTTPYQEAFWNQNWDGGVEWYLEQIPVSSKFQVTMETSSTYIFNGDFAKKISHVKPDMKLIVLVCNPVDRAMSDFVHLSGMGYPERFEQRPQDYVNNLLPYVAETFDKSVVDVYRGDPLKQNSLLVRGQYDLYLRTWLKYFPMKNFLILDGSSFKVHPLPILRQVEDFLEIPQYFDEDKLYHDTSKGFFCRATPSRLCTTKSVGRRHPPIDDDISRKLKTFYRKNNKELELLTGRNFTWF